MGQKSIKFDQLVQQDGFHSVPLCTAGGTMNISKSFCNKAWHWIEPPWLKLVETAKSRKGRRVAADLTTKAGTIFWAAVSYAGRGCLMRHKRMACQERWFAGQCWWCHILVWSQHVLCMGVTTAERMKKERKPWGQILLLCPANSHLLGRPALTEKPVARSLHVPLLLFLHIHPHHRHHHHHNNSCVRSSRIDLGRVSKKLDFSPKLWVGGGQRF